MSMLFCILFCHSTVGKGTEEGARAVSKALSALALTLCVRACLAVGRVCGLKPPAGMDAEGKEAESKSSSDAKADTKDGDGDEMSDPDVKVRAREGRRSAPSMEPSRRALTRARARSRR